MISLSLLLLSSLTYDALTFRTGPAIPICCNRGSAPKARHNKLFSASNIILPQGISKDILKEGTGSSVCVGDVATVRYACYLLGADKILPLQKPFAKSKEQKVTT